MGKDQKGRKGRGKGLKAALISLGSTSSQWTVDAMKNYFSEVDMLNIKKLEINFSGKNAEVLYHGEPIEEYDCIYAKGSYKYAPLLRSITSILSEHCYMPIAPDTFTVVHDKLLTQLQLQKKEVPMPRTYLASTLDEAKNILDRINYPIILKLPKGTHGKGVMYAETKKTAASMLDALSALKQPFIIQEFVDTSRSNSEGGSDIRAIVIGDKVVASMERKAQSREFRANLHSGAGGDSIELDTEAANTAVKVAQAIGADIAGVDLLMSVKGPMVIEANASPGLQGITRISGIDVADKIAKFLYKKTKERKEKKKQEAHGEIMNDIKESRGEEQEFITGLDFRGGRVLLPEVVTKITGFNESNDYRIKVKEDELNIKKFKM